MSRVRYRDDDLYPHIMELVAQLCVAERRVGKLEAENAHPEVLAKADERRIQALRKLATAIRMVTKEASPTPADRQTGRALDATQVR